MIVLSGHQNISGISLEKGSSSRHVHFWGTSDNVIRRSLALRGSVMTSFHMFWLYSIEGVSKRSWSCKYDTFVLGLTPREEDTGQVGCG